MEPTSSFVRPKGPWADVPPARRRVMQANRSRDTVPELKVRKLLHKMGYRFRLHRRDLPGCPDIVFPGRRSVIFVHGCFWHQHPECRDARQPKTRTEYWGPKLARNVARDDENQRLLLQMGWAALVVWECETAHPCVVAQRAEAFLGRTGRGWRT